VTRRVCFVERWRVGVAGRGPCKCEGCLCVDWPLICSTSYVN